LRDGRSDSESGAASHEVKAAPAGSGAYYIEVLGKALDVLEVFARSQKPRLTLQEISTLSKLHKNTVFRILHTLAEHSYLVKCERAYELGPKILELSNGRLRGRELLAAAAPHMDALRDRFEETVNLGVLDGKQIRYVAVRESPHRFRLAEYVGAFDYLHCTALGKCHLAHLPFEQVRQLLRQQGLPRQTERTIVTLNAMTTELERVRERGYALDAGESTAGAFCVAVPILDRDGAPLAALSISGPTVRFNETVLPPVVKALLHAAAGIRTSLGFVSE